MSTLLPQSSHRNCKLSGHWSAIDTFVPLTWYRQTIECYSTSRCIIIAFCNTPLTVLVYIAKFFMYVMNMLDIIIYCTVFLLSTYRGQSTKSRCNWQYISNMDWHFHIIFQIWKCLKSKERLCGLNNTSKSRKNNTKNVLMVKKNHSKYCSNTNCYIYTLKS